MASMEDMTDEDLMDTLQKNGDHQAFSFLVQRHTGRYYALAYRMMMNKQEAEDIVQDAFLKLWTKSAQWNVAKGVKFTTWFGRIVYNRCLDKKKSLQNKEVVIDIEFKDDTVSADVQMDLARKQQSIEDAIGTLPERQRDALNLCFYEGYSNKDAADVMDVKVKALESLLMRAKAGLKKVLLGQDTKLKTGGRTNAKRAG